MHIKRRTYPLVFLGWISAGLLIAPQTMAEEVSPEHLTPNRTAIEAGDLKLVLEKGEQGIRPISLLDKIENQQLLAADSSSLFSATLRNAKTKEQVSIHAASGWSQVDIEKPEEKNRYVLTFRQPVDNRFRGIDVTVTLTPQNSDHAFQWDIHITNNNTEWSLWHVVFPQLSLVRMEEGAKVFVPLAAGIENTELWNQNLRKGGTYPNGWICMQYMAAYHPARRIGLYVGVHDPFGSTKDIFAQGRSEKQAVNFTFDHPVPDMGKARNDFDLPGQAVWQLLRGDWYDAAMIYRQWASQQAKWWPQLGPDGRTDTPHWMRELPAWAQTGGAASQCVDRVAAMAKKLQLPIGFHWYNWHQIPFDNDYTHYFPPKEDFAQGVTELKKAGVYVMPYINGRLWDTRDKGAEDWQFTRTALAAATKNEKGQPYTETYSSKETDGSKVKLAVMCPATPLWQNRMREIVLKLFQEYGLNGVYIDQIAAAKPRLCFDASHGHPLGGGHWWTQGYWQLLDAIRKAKPTECMLTTECNAEPYIKWLDGYLTWHWQYQDMVPAFSAVYGGAIQMFGRAYRGGPTQDLAHRMKAAQQLVFGEQIGWCSPEIINRPESGKFLQDCIRLRWQLRRYFYAGRMTRPPILLDEIPTVTADWQWSGEWPITTQAVMTGAWYLPRQKKLVIIFANVSDRELSTRLKCPFEECNLTQDSLQVLTRTPQGPGEKFGLSGTKPPKITLFPRSVLAWEIP